MASNGGIVPPRAGIRPALIKNKAKRAQVHAKQRAEKKEYRRKMREKRQREVAELGDDNPRPKAVPRTLDNTRTADDTVVEPGDVEVLADEAEDEFASYFDHGQVPKLMITTQQHASAPTFTFIRDLMTLFPKAFYYRRGKYTLKKICKWAANKKFTHLLVLNEKAKKIHSMYICHLPYGPTAMFKLSSSQLGKDIKHHGRPTSHLPEIILNNFTTRLGHRVGRMLGSLFPHTPEFHGRRVVTFHNQRDFIFVRHHRYMFDPDGKRARLQELGPRFTLKLRWLQAGTFDTTQGEYEWVHKRKEMDLTRRTFHM